MTFVVTLKLTTAVLWSQAVQLYQQCLKASLGGSNEPANAVYWDVHENPLIRVEENVSKIG